MRTCIFPPPRTIGTYAGTAPSASARHSSATARWRSTSRYRGSRCAPGAISIDLRYHCRSVKSLSWACVLALVWATRAAAHPVPFSYLDLRLAAGSIEGSLVVHVFDAAHDLNLSPPEKL